MSRENRLSEALTVGLGRKGKRKKQEKIGRGEDREEIDKVKNNTKQEIVEIERDMDGVEGVKSKDKKKKRKKNEGGDDGENLSSEKGKKRKSREVDGGER